MKFKIELAKRLVKVADITEMQNIITVLFTESELEEIEKRGKILRLLLAKNTQREVSEELGVGIATVTRGAKQIKKLNNPNWWTNWLWR